MSDNEAEREALEDAIETSLVSHETKLATPDGSTPCVCGVPDARIRHQVETLRDAILAAGFRRVQVTDEMVSEADRAYVLAMASDPRPWFAMRAALEAALNGEEK